MRESIIGKKFNMLTVLDDYITVKNGRKYKCRCDCGNELYVYRGKITTSHTKSCGCIRETQNNLSKHRLYRIWSNMKERCYNSNSDAYRNYGRKGIKVCDMWIDNFIEFYNWSMTNGYSDELTIERKNSNSDYSPHNCEWITLSENVSRANKGSHRRKTKYTYYGISPNGEKYTFSNANKFAKENSLNANSVRAVARGERNSYYGWEFGYTSELNM